MRKNRVVGVITMLESKSRPKAETVVDGSENEKREEKESNKPFLPK